MGGYWALTIIMTLVFEYDGFTLTNWVSAYEMWVRSLLHIDLIVYLAVLSLGYTISYYQSSRDEQLRNENLARQLVQVELQALKAQINPHFLFNTLNTIASLIRLDKKDQAVKALTELSMMLRKVLEHQSSQLTTLEQELEFINSYLAIQQMRFENKLQVKLDIDADCLHNDIPFMLLQPLVENAVQHGSQLESDNNLLSLTIKQHFNQLKVELINKVSEKSEHKGFGIGIKNCRERLDKLYQGKFSLQLQPLENHYFKTSLLIPLGEHND
ncbi:histidine kinase [Neptunicella marina]|uniref:Histidine kinase n=2 Tax=Neptunicella marina TaxID=2125989 RepID=A0A8J6IUG6_9ALTE|nr:histidine kinase [Neptunicella marina]